MGGVRYLKDLVLGKVRRWDETNNAVIDGLSRRLESLDSPNCLILRHLLSSTRFVVESLIGPLPPWVVGLNYQRGSKRPIDFDPQRIGTSELRRLYTILLAYFVFVFYKTNLVPEDELRKALFEVIEGPGFTKEFLDSLEGIGKVHMGSGGGQKIKAERWMAWRFYERVWGEIVEVVGLPNHAKLESLYYFASVSELAYENAIRDIQAELHL